MLLLLLYGLNVALLTLLHVVALIAPTVHLAHAGLQHFLCLVQMLAQFMILLRPGRERLLGLLVVDSLATVADFLQVQLNILRVTPHFLIY